MKELFLSLFFRSSSSSTLLVRGLEHRALLPGEGSIRFRGSETRPEVTQIFTAQHKTKKEEERN
jgi:hypothetical protein